jgi:hypothetical protein
MCLRFSATLITGTVLAVSTLAYAKTQPKTTPAPAKAPAPATLPASGLAQVQAIFSYCELVDPHSAAKYERVRSVVISGHSSSEIGDDERSAAYRSELGVMAADLLKIPVITGVSSCRTVIAGL